MIKLFKNLTKVEWILVAVSIAFVVGQVWLDLKMPDFMHEITTLVQTKGSAMSAILKNGGYMLLCALGSLFSSVIVAILASRIASNFSAILRGKLFSSVQSFSMQEMNKFSTASLITRSTNDITQVQMFIVMGLQALIKAPITAVWAIVKISGKAWQWSFSTSMAIILLVAIVIVVMMLVIPKFKKVQKLTDDVNRVSRENLTGIKVVRAYNADEYQEKKFDDVNTELMKTNLFTGRTMAFMMPTIQLIMSGLTLAIYWIGAYLIESSDMAVERIALLSDTMVYTQYAMQILMSFMMLVMIFIILPRASVSGKRINEVLSQKPTIVGGNKKGDENKKGEIVFNNVSFKYPDAEDYVIQNLSFSASKGETIAFIGSSGSGKSTVINLVPRFYDATEGEVLVDGVNVKDYNEQDLRNKISYVSQKAVLFSGTVESNITYGDNGRDMNDKEALQKAIETAQAKDFVEAKEGGINGYVAQGGTNFSGGQKQRLSIARAIYRNPEIYIFDDSFSALDYKTDKVLRETLNKHAKDATKLIVAQRIGTIRDADKIVVLDEGQMVGIGTHDELIQSCSVYKEIALSQLSQEEI